MILEEYDEEQHMRTVYQEGYESGHQEGDRKRLIRSICHLLQKGYASADIAELLGENLRLVERICSLLQAAAPEYDIEEIYRAL